MKTIHFARRTRLLTIIGLALAISFVPYVPHRASATTLAQRIIFSNFAQFPSNTIVTTNPDGSDPQSLLTGIPAKLSPDGSKLLFGRFRGQFNPILDIYSANADGSNITLLSDPNTYIRSGLNLQWSPDSQNVYFQGTSNNVSGYYTMRADGSNLQLLNQVTDVLDSALSSDGTKYLITKSGGDYDTVLQGTMNLDGSNQVLTRAQGQPCDQWIWSHDRSRVACRLGNGLAVMNADGSNQQLIEAGPQNGDVDAYEYIWSPDDTKLVFHEYTGTADPNTHTSISHTYVINADGSGRYQIPGADDSSPADWAIMPVANTAPTLGQPTWSTNPKTVSQATTLTIPVTPGTSAVTGGEYYLGASDPGQGNGVPMTLNGNNLTATFGTALAPGQYQVTARGKDANNLWSNIVTTQLTIYENDSQVNGSGRITPTFGTDVMPGLTHNGQFDHASFSLSANKHFGEVDPQSSLTFDYKAGLVCFLPFINIGCHTTNFATIAVTQLSTAGPNNSQVDLQGTGTLSIDGTTTTNPFRATATDGSRLTPAATDRFQLEIFAVGADPATATPLYHVDQAVQQGNIAITL